METLGKLIAEDKVKCVELVKELGVIAHDIVPLVKQLLRNCKNGHLNMKKGISFLDVKNHQMLSYLINLTHLILQKTAGKSIENSIDIERLVEIRTVLEKMKPTEQKLKYQIDKLVRIGTGISAAENNPLRLKPNPDKLISKLDDDTQAEDESETTNDKSQVYKPAKLIPMFYDGDETSKQRQERLLEKSKSRMANSAVMRDLYQQYRDGPEEIRDAAGLHRAREDKKEREKREYEENYFVRKSLTKKELNAAKRMRTVSELHNITSFPDLSLVGVNSKRKKEDGSRKRQVNTKRHKGSAKKQKFRK